MRDDEVFQHCGSDQLPKLLTEYRELNRTASLVDKLFYGPQIKLIEEEIDIRRQIDGMLEAAGLPKLPNAPAHEPAYREYRSLVGKPQSSPGTR